MKKFLVILVSVLLISGCSLFSSSPKKAVEELFKKYQNLDDEVVSDLELSTEASNYESEQKESYMKAMKMQYSDLKYEIEDEEVNGDEATVKVKINVYDFYKANNAADMYLEEHPDEFLTDKVYDAAKFLKYKLDSLLNMDERVDYTITLNLSKDGNKWVVNELDKTTLEKIHGTYNYEEE